MALGRIGPLLPRLRELVSRQDDGRTDCELLLHFGAAGDEAAFAEIVRRHGPMLLRVCQRVLHNSQDAEDVCQAAFLLLAQKATSTRWHDSVAGWLFQTARRLALKARGAAGRRARQEARARPASSPDPVADLMVSELQSVLDEELSRLPEKYRAPILLCCLEGRSRDEAANCLGWQLATVKDRLERGRERLRVRLARRGVLLGTALASVWLVEGPARAGVSPHATAQAAALFASGRATLAGLLPPHVAALAKGVTMTVLLCRMTIVAAGIALALGAAAGLTRRSIESPPARAEAPPAKPARVAAAPVRPEAMPLVGHKGAVTAVAFARRGKSLATAGADHTVRVWDTTTGTQLHKREQPGKVLGVAFSPDGKTLAAVSGGKKGAIIAWEVVTGKQLWWNASTPPGQNLGGGGAVAFVPDGKTVVAGLTEGVTVAFSSEGMILFAFQGQRGGATALACSPDGKFLVLGDEGGTVGVLDSASGRLLRSWRGKRPVTAVAFFPEGTRLATADGGKAVRILDVSNGKEETGFEGKEDIRALALSPDGKRMATAGADGGVVLWDTSGKQERRFSARGAVNALAWAPDGKRLATVGGDGAILWDLTRDEKPLPGDFTLTQKALNALWIDLASDEGGKLYAAARQLRADPARAVPFLQQRLRSKADGPDRKRLARLIADLDSDEFEKREKASKELEKLGKAAETALREALAGRPSLEARLRLGRLLKPLGDKNPTAEQQRDVRAVRVLEQMGTPQAKKLLDVLSKESSGWWVMQEAREALRRLARRESKP